MPETIENSLVESEEVSLTTRISRLLCIGAISNLFRDLKGVSIENNEGE